MAKGIRKRDIESFEKCAKRMDQIMRRIRKYNPEANLFVAGFEMNLMAGDHLNEDSLRKGEMRVSSVIVTGCDAGDW